MKILRWLDENLEKTICTALALLMIAVLFLQVVMRRGFNRSLFWSEELARYTMIWLIYIGVSYAAKLKRHIKIEGFLSVIPKASRPYMLLFGEILFWGFAVFIVIVSFGLVQLQMEFGARSPALDIPLSVVYAAPTVGFLLTTIRQTQVIIGCIKDIKQGKEESDG